MSLNYAVYNHTTKQIIISAKITRQAKSTLAKNFLLLFALAAPVVIL
ncbi:hypothetical protein HMPREF3034_00134 [Prevotella sp. DNF00663]|nr:hypothetical protein HMPREF3034_00134 [Prevotella sp. DNF00663]